jgi:hypothetical protein
MSFAHTGSGARFVAAWGSVHHVGVIPVDELTVTDDRGARYTLEGIPSGDPGWAAEIWLRPTPPKDIRWLDVAPPYRQPARIDLRAASPGIPDGEPRVSAAELSPGEHLLIRLAEHLLTSAPNPRGRWRATAPGGPLRPLTTGLGDIVGALEAADVLSPLSPVPARLATLCASMDIDGHGIAAAPAYDLPEPWVSVLAHYRRRKPEPVPLGEGYAALAASLPALDGIRLALLGLHHTEGSSYLHVLARGRMPDPRPGPLAADLTFPLSVWLRDSGGRWHACCPSLQHRADCECLIRMQLVPPLTRPTDRLEVLAGGQAAEVRTILPLGWRYPS